MTKLEEYLSICASPKYREQFANFKKDIFIHTLRWEGGGKLHNVEGDSGGWTIWGIAYNYNKQIFKDLADFKDTTYEEAAAIAFCKYYVPIHAEAINSKAKLMYFDMAYNLGSVRAIKIMQKCANVIDDGLIGAVTLSKMPYVTEECLYQRRNSFYNGLVKQSIKFQKFLKGWLNRSTAIFNID